MEQLKSHILKLSEPEKSELLKWFISQMLNNPIEWDQLAEAIKRVQDWDKGKIQPLSHEQFWLEVDNHINKLDQRNGL